MQDFYVVYVCTVGPAANQEENGALRNTCSPRVSAVTAECTDDSGHTEPLATARRDFASKISACCKARIAQQLHWKIHTRVYTHSEILLRGVILAAEKSMLFLKKNKHTCIIMYIFNEL